MKNSFLRQSWVNASKNSFVFSTLNAKFDSSSKIESLIKVEDNIGEISISDL